MKLDIDRNTLATITKKVGGDPEFEVLNKFVITSANKVLGIEDYDTVSSIGTDGNSNILEIRPDPAENTIELLNNARKLYEIFSKKYPDATLCSIGNKYPLGAHVHLSIPPTKALVGFLDTVIGIPTLCLNSDVRKRIGFTGLNLISEKAYGFEYRTATGLWSHPELLKFVGNILFSFYASDSLHYFYGKPDTIFSSFGLDYSAFKTLIAKLENRRNLLDVLGNWNIKSKCSVWRNTYMPDTAKNVLNLWRPEVPVIVYGLADNIPAIVDFNINDEWCNDVYGIPAPQTFADIREKVSTYAKYYVYVGLSKEVREDEYKLKDVIEKVEYAIQNYNIERS
jgi:hypothetical protein